MTYQYFGYIHVPIFFSLFKLTIYTRLNINKYIITIKNTICEQNACIQFPFNKYIKHLVPPQAGQSIPVCRYTQHCGIKFIYLELTKLYKMIKIIISINIIKIFLFFKFISPSFLLYKIFFRNTRQFFQLYAFFFIWYIK